MPASELFAVWSLRAALVGVLFTASEPLTMAVAMLVLTLQLPFQRAVLEWDRRKRFAPVFVAPYRRFETLSRPT